MKMILWCAICDDLFAKTYTAKVNYNRKGICDQLHDKIVHTAQNLLPQLHGLATLLDESSLHTMDLEATVELSELEDIFERLHVGLGQALRGRSSTKPSAVSDITFLWGKKCLSRLRLLGGAWI